MVKVKLTKASVIKVLRKRGTMVLDLMAKIIDAGNVANAEVPEHLKWKDWKNNTNIPSNYPSSPTTQPVPPRSNDFNNNLYIQPIQPYTTNIFVNTNLYNTLPSRPSSLLPITKGTEVLNQTPTKVVIGEPISLAQATSEQQFGRLISNPFSLQKQKIRQIQTDGVAQELKKLNDEGIEAFAGYLVKEEGSTALDAVAFVLPIALKGVSGELNMIFGYETLRYYFSTLTGTSANARIGVSSSIPNGYEIVPVDFEIKKSADILENIGLKDSSGANLSGLEELLEQEINWEDWIAEAATAQYGQSENESNEIVIENDVEFIKNLIAPFYFRLGLNKLPFDLPKHLAVENDEDNEDTRVKANQLSEYLLWQLSAFDSVIGQFPIKIKIEDSDLIQTGDQPIELSFPNLAETLADLIGFNLTNKTTSNALLEIALKQLAETGQNKQQIVQSYYLLAAIQEYLGFETKQIIKEVDFLFNPNMLAEPPSEHSLSKALAPSKVKVAIEDNIDEDSLEKHMVALIEAARIIKAVHYRSINLNGDAVGQLASIFKNAGNLADKFDDDSRKKLKAYLERVEIGFSNEINFADPTKPYGRSYNERPRTREIDQDGDRNKPPQSP